MRMDDAAMSALFALAGSNKPGQSSDSTAVRGVFETLQAMSDYLLTSRDSVGLGDGRYPYTRKQAVAAGALIDLSSTGAAQAHWPAPLGCTQTVYSILEEAVARETLTLDAILDRVSQAAKASLPNQVAGRFCFEVVMAGRKQLLLLVCSRDDNGQPVLTLLLPSEGLFPTPYGSSRPGAGRATDSSRREGTGRRRRQPQPASVPASTSAE